MPRLGPVVVLIAAALAGVVGEVQAQDGGATPPPATTTATVVDTAFVDTAAVYTPGDLTTPAVVNNRDDVVRALLRNYPKALRDKGLSGSATVEVVIDRRGRVERVRTVGATIPEFGQAAEAVVRVMRFKPGMVHGVPVRVRFELPVNFTLE